MTIIHITNSVHLRHSIVHFAGVLFNSSAVCAMVHLPNLTRHTFLEVVYCARIHIYTGKDNEIKMGQTG